SAPTLRGPGACLPITGDPGEWQMAEREPEGGGEGGRARTRQPGLREGTLLQRCTASEGGTLMSAEVSARSVRQADGLDPVRALQRVLYRSAKQDRTRRFHALYDKLARSDVMWQAWINVAKNQGAPGVDGVSIDSITAGGMEGVRSFLDELTVEVRAQSYRPQPLLRVNIPK